MHAQTHQELMSHIDQIGIHNTATTNNEYEIMLLKRGFEELAVNNDTRAWFLSGAKIGDAGALLLSELLKLDTTLEQLDIANHNIGDKGALSLANLLQHNTTLRFLDISENKIGEEGIIALATAIEHNTTLESILIDGIELTEKGMIKLANIMNRVEGQYI
jgi:Ran GTPase-activating protein (RanGAP) involved in mRNA processing and transport